MKHLKQYIPLVIEELSADEFHYPRHHQNYFELIYICKGKGVSHINTIQLPYQEGDLCFVSPDDNHYFEVHEFTTFVFIKFTSEYIKQVQHLVSPWQQQIFDPISLFSDNYLKEQCLNWNTIEKKRIKSNIEDILQSHDSSMSTNSISTYFQLLVILSTVYEHLKILRRSQIPDNIANHLPIYYIHEHIYNPRQLKITKIANHFNISTQYFSAWFKQAYQTGYKEYIDSYRIELLKNRLTHSKASLKAIAVEFGFSDSSHFSNYFFKHTKKRPQTFRRVFYEKYLK